MIPWRLFFFFFNHIELLRYILVQLIDGKYLSLCIELQLKMIVMEAAMIIFC